MRVSLLITAGSLALLFAGSLSVQAAGSTMYGAGLPRDNQVETAASIRMRMRRCWTDEARA